MQEKIAVVRGTSSQEWAFVTWVSYIALWGEGAGEETRFDFYGPSAKLREELVHRKFWSQSTRPKTPRPLQH